jgi:hypothetical protein
MFGRLRGDFVFGSCVVRLFLQENHPPPVEGV